MEEKDFVKEFEKFLLEAFSTPAEVKGEEYYGVWVGKDKYPPEFLWNFERREDAIEVAKAWVEDEGGYAEVWWCNDKCVYAVLSGELDQSIREQIMKRSNPEKVEEIKK